MMDINRESAKIYTFPRRPTAAATYRNGGRPAVDLRTPSPEVDFGSAWYHQAAVQEAEQTRKR